MISALVLVMVWFQFRGYFDTKAKLYVVSPRSGLSMDPGSKVTYNGVPIGRVKEIEVRGVAEERLRAELAHELDLVRIVVEHRIDDRTVLRRRVPHEVADRVGRLVEESLDLQPVTIGRAAAQRILHSLVATNADL